MNVFAGGRRIGTECCGSKLYTITHKGTFCGNCDAPVYLWNGLLVTEEREEEIRLSMKRIVQAESSWSPPLSDAPLTSDKSQPSTGG